MEVSLTMFFLKENIFADNALVTLLNKLFGKFLHSYIGVMFVLRCKSLLNWVTSHIIDSNESYILGLVNPNLHVVSF
jgi:hypothetical protein